MKRKRRKPTRREWELITSRRPVVRRMITKSSKKDTPVAFKGLDCYGTEHEEGKC